MAWALRLGAGVAALCALGLGCRKPEAPSERSAPAKSLAVELRISLSNRAALRPGDDLLLGFHVTNRSGRQIQIVRPVYGSWEGARHPSYSLEFVGEDGKSYPAAIGHAPGLDCGTLDLIGEEDIVRIDPGKIGHFSNDSPIARRLRVLPDARPGRYRLRVRYVATKERAATPLELLSDQVDLVVAQGDERLWRCRQEQLAVEGNHSFAQVAPFAVLPWKADDREKRYVLVYTTIELGVADGGLFEGGSVMMQPLAEDGKPTGAPVVVARENDGVGFVAAVGVDTGFLVAYTPGPVGQRRIQVVSVSASGSTLSPAAPRGIQAGPGNPYVVALASAGGKAALVASGPGTESGALLLRLLKPEGTQEGKETLLARGQEHRDQGFVSRTANGWEVAWQRPVAASGALVVQSLNDRGTANAGPIEFRPIDGSVVAYHRESQELQIVYNDASVMMQNPADTMGLWMARFGHDGRRLGEPVALSPLSRKDARFGVAAWLGAEYARVYAETLPGLPQGSGVLRFGVGSRPPEAPMLLSSSAHEGLIAALGDRYFTVWPDYRDDQSKACSVQHRCVTEVYGSLIDREGRVLAPPTRITRASRSQPFLPDEREWQQFCPK